MSVATAELPKAQIDDLYLSRVENRPHILPRRDPVIYGTLAEQPGEPLSEQQLKSFEEQGFLILPNFFTQNEVETCRIELQRLCSSDDIKSMREAIVEPAQRDLRSLFAVHRICPLFAKVAADERVLSMVRTILGSDVYIHQSRVNLKPGLVGKEFYWHSDFETWHVEDGMPRMRAVSCSILLTPNNAFNGPLMLVPGSHRHYVACVGETPEEHYVSSLRRQEYGVPDAESLSRLVEEGGIESAVGDAGSLVLFDCNTMHGSNGNISPWPRSNLFFVYNSVENRLQSPFCGLKPRPEHIATRETFEPVSPHHGAWA